MKKSLAKQWKESGVVKDKRLIRAFEQIPREKFIHEELVEDAYADRPLPIGYGQTISQPTTIMMMIEALELKKSDKVLEIGSGSGYNAAIMSKLCKKVYTVEIVPELVHFARENLKRIGIKNVEVIGDDGSRGYEPESPYDKIMVTAGCPSMPKPLAGQLKEGGIIVAPVGEMDEQEMVKAKKVKGKLKKEKLGMFVFVPLIGRHGHKKP